MAFGRPLIGLLKIHEETQKIKAQIQHHWRVKQQPAKSPEKPTPYLAYMLTSLIFSTRREHSDGLTATALQLVLMVSPISQPARLFRQQRAVPWPEDFSHN